MNICLFSIKVPILVNLP